MSKREIKAGSTDQTIDVFIQDSSSTTGAGLSGLVYNSASLACYYRKGATGSATQLSLATQTVGGAHSDGGFVEIQATNMKGVYRLDLSDTMVASAGMLTIMLYGATNMAPVVAEVEVVSVDKFDAVRMGLTALPNANAEASGGLYTRGTGAGQINQDGNGRIDVNIAAISTDTVAADNLESYTDGTTPAPVNAIQLSGDATAADNAESFFDGTGYAGTNNVIPLVTTTTTATNVTTVNGLAAGVITAASIAADAITDAKVASDVTIASVTGSVGSVTGAVGSVTGNVGGNVVGSVGSVTGAVGSVTATVNANMTQISGDSTAADNAEAFYEGAFLTGSVSDVTPAVGDFTAAAGLSASNDFYNRTTLVFTSGTLKGIPRVVTDYVGSTRTFQFSGATGEADAPFPTAPADGDTFIIIGLCGIQT